MGVATASSGEVRRRQIEAVDHRPELEKKRSWRRFGMFQQAMVGEEEEGDPTELVVVSDELGDAGDDRSMRRPEIVSRRTPRERVREREDKGEEVIRAGGLILEGGRAVAVGILARIDGVRAARQQLAEGRKKTKGVLQKTPWLSEELHRWV
jgi:hypothetical protein